MVDHNTRAHALLSASSSARWLACPPSAVAAEAYPAQDTEYTREGTRAHEIAELVARGEQVPDDTDKEMLACAEEYRDYVDQLCGPYAAVLLEQRVDLSPWVPDGFGSTDCVIIQGDTMDVIDYKYGKGVAVSAVNNSQMKLYGLGAINEYGDIGEIRTVRLHIFQPRLNNISVFELTADDLLSWAADVVKPIAAEAYAGKGDYHAGDHCRFCPHAGRCPELARTCREVVEIYGTEVDVPILSPFDLADILSKESMISNWLKRVKAQAVEDITSGKHIPGFKLVAGRPGNRKWTDEVAVADKLKGQGYSQEDYTETKLLSPAAMDKSLGKKRAGELLADLVTRSPGAPTIAPETDKRPAYNPADDFDRLEE